jgi:hypothetical protein
MGRTADHGSDLRTGGVRFFVQVIKLEGTVSHQVVAGLQRPLGYSAVDFSAGAIDVQSGSNEIDPHVFHKE